jgi:hypothetical protein
MMNGSWRFVRKVAAEGFTITIPSGGKLAVRLSFLGK